MSKKSPELIWLHYLPVVLLFLIALVIGWSFHSPYDMFTWWLEAIPALVGILILAVTFRKFRFSNFCYLVIFVHMVVLLVGAHYSYAREPFFDLIKDAFHLSRNHFDRLGHFMQGFGPAIIAREILQREKIVPSPHWTNFFVITICLSISAFYELIEWWVAIATGTASLDFIGSQGDVWDTQSDMMMALIGSLCAVFLFRRLHESSVQKILHE